MTDVDDLTRDYRVAFLGYLPRREEAALNRGYELGRSAVADGIGLLELAQVHHTIFLEAMSETPVEELPEVASAASEFFLEVLATFDLAQRAFLAGCATPRCEPTPGRGAGSRPPGPAPSPRAHATPTASAFRRARACRDEDPTEPAA
jgi:Phosphoserine phosphatase RsbU, N-terminal domain